MKFEIKAPGGNVPAVFSRIEELQQQRLSGLRTELVAGSPPLGTFARFQERVGSSPISVPGSDSTVTLAGRADAILALDDGSFGVADLKTAVPNERTDANYSRQLHAYARCLEDASPGSLTCAPIARLGLVVYNPTAFRLRSQAIRPAVNAVLGGELTWIEVTRDDASFFRVLSEVVEVLDRPMPPDPSARCSVCGHSRRLREAGLTERVAR